MRLNRLLIVLMLLFSVVAFSQETKLKIKSYKFTTEHQKLSDVTEPKTEFETEQEAIDWAYEEDKYADWLILTKISFKREY